MTAAGKIKSFFKSIYDKLVRIDDSPQRIALGFGLGVFCGILPGTGPMAAVVLALIFRVNKIAAFAGGLLTNTWLSLVTLVLAVKIGSALTGADWHDIYEKCKGIVTNFSFQNLKNIPVSKIFLPLAIGYFLVGLVSGVLAYLIALFVFKKPRFSDGKA
jgi:uncharacterized protein (DUF2062 family)